IRHVHNGGEQSFRTIVDAYFVDGYDPLICTVYEFHGCLYHGCPRCYPSRRHYAVPERSVEELYQATLCKRMALLRADYTVIEMWECEWDRLVDSEPAKRDYILRYQEREGIRLDIASIAKNPGRKATTKLMLNSFWGKFGERVNKPTTVTVKDPAHLFSLISDAAVDLSTLRLCTDDILE
ncbi:unnamed protein product, partial [Porites lobata]